MNRLRRLAAALDDRALTALASKGILRRARSDLGRETPEILNETSDSLLCASSGCEVRLRDPPSESTCSCASTHVCQHIVCCWLRLARTSDDSRDEAAREGHENRERHDDHDDHDDAAQLAEASEEILALSSESLETWAGKVLWRRSLVELDEAHAVEFETQGTWSARFPNWNLACHWVRGAGLAGMLCECHRRKVCLHRVLAISIFLGKAGRKFETTESSEQADAPRDVDRVLGSVESILTEMVAIGLSRLSETLLHRVRGLAISAHGVDLPRLERSLDALASAITAWLRREPHADGAEILARASVTFRWVQEIRSDASSATIHGVPRSHRLTYEVVDALDLVGAGGSLWTSTNGYRGWTVYFWDVNSRCWRTWSEARPRSQVNFRPERSYFETGPWKGGSSGALLSKLRIRLDDARVSSTGRISSSRSSRMTTIADSDLGMLPDPIEDWSLLRDILREELRADSSLDRESLALIRPASWGIPEFRSSEQKFVRHVFDREGHPAILEVKYEHVERPRIESLETLDVAQLPSLLISLRLRDGRMSLYPISAISVNGIHSLSIVEPDPGQKSSSSRPEPSKRGASADYPIELSGASMTCNPGNDSLGHRLSRTGEALAHLAESGPRAFRDLELLEGCSRELALCGLTSLAESLDRLIEALRDADSSARIAPRLFEATSLLHLVTACVAVERSSSISG